MLSFSSSVVGFNLGFFVFFAALRPLELFATCMFVYNDRCQCHRGIDPHSGGWQPEPAPQDGQPQPVELFLTDVTLMNGRGLQESALQLNLLVQLSVCGISFALVHTLSNTSAVSGGFCAQAYRVDIDPF